MQQKDQMTNQASEDVTALGMAAEPAVAYSSESHSLARVGEFHIPEEIDPGIGPYTMAEIDQQLAEADASLRDKSQWSTLSEILSDFKQEHAQWFK